MSTEMVSVLAVGIASFLLATGSTFFFNQPEDDCSPAPNLVILLYLLAAMCFLWVVFIYPSGSRRMRKFWQLGMELLACSFISEVSPIVMWCCVKRFLTGFTGEMLKLMGPSGDCETWRYQYWAVVLITTSMAGALLWYMLKATDGMYFPKKFLRELKKKWRRICFWRMNQRARACKLVMPRYPPNATGRHEDEVKIEDY